MMLVLIQKLEFLAPHHCKCSQPKNEKKIIKSVFQILVQHTICQTCIMLSSETEQITHGSFGFHEKSEILAVCPP